MRCVILSPHLAALDSFSRATRRSTRKAALALCSVVVLLAGGAAKVCGQSALDGFDPNPNGPVFAVVVQHDGKILLGGDFTTLSPNGGVAVTRNGIARLNPDGTLDSAFDPGGNERVFSIVVQTDGKILVGGDFTSIGGQPRNHIARLDGTTGSADSFNPDANGFVNDIALQADGKILAVGAFTSIGGETRGRIARLDATTGLADSFDPNANTTIETILVQPDGKVLVGGFFTSIGGQPRNRIARLDLTTGLADSFNPNSTSFVSSIAVQADGKILVGGPFFNIGGAPRHGIARLDATTGLADSFDPDASSGGVTSIAVQPDGKILVGGFFNNIGGQTRNRIARLDATTGLADPFDPDANNDVYAIAVQADGKILAGGVFTNIGGETRNNLGRLESDGRLDQSLNLRMVRFGPSSYVVATAVQPDGKILIGGYFSSVLGVQRSYMARVNADGTLDHAFNPSANNVVNCIAVQPDGRILAGGYFTRIGGQDRNHIARLDPVSGLPDSFNPDSNGVVYSLAVQADGQILVGGSFTNIGGQPRNRIARLDPATGLPDSFDPNASCTECGSAGSVWSMAVLPDGKIVAGGFFNLIGGQPRNHLARLDAMTGLADSFDPDADFGVQSVAVQADGRVLAGGGFSSIGGQMRNRIARLDATTGSADSFNPNANGRVFAITVQADGKIVVGGLFNSIGGQTRNGIARLNATTGVADSFDPDASREVYAIAVPADGKILAGGEFTSIGGQRRGLFARLSNDTAALQDLAVTRATITWTRAGSSPQFSRVAFESSNDNINYSPLGNGTRDGSGWTLTGLNLPTGQIYIRARGYYPSGGFNGSLSILESVRNAFVTGATPTPTPAAQAINLSTRMRVQTGDNVGIGGFIVAGTAPKHVLLRAIGPSLAQFGVPDVLGNPTLELHGPTGFATIFNDGWRDDPVQEALIIASGIPPANDLESAIDAALNPGAYTAIVRGTNNSSGVALVEVYDLSPAMNSNLANISTRAFVDTGDDIVIAGFILGNNSGDDRVVLRGIGPSLISAGVANVLPDPTLQLRDSNGALLVTNNDWQDDPAQAAELIVAGLAPTNQLESGIAAALPPGPYTVLLAGLNNGTGIGLVEVYDRGGAGNGGPTPSPTPSATATVAPTPSATPTPTPTGTPTPIPTPSPACVFFEDFDDITTLPGAGWVQANRSETLGTTGWFQGNGAVFPAQSGGVASYIAANFDSTTDAKNPNDSLLIAPLTLPGSASPTPTPGPPQEGNTISNWLLTPPLTLQDGATMIFYTRTVDVPQFPDRLQVRMSTNGTSTNVGTTATDVGDFTTLLLDLNPSLTSTGYPNVWTQFTVTVSGIGSPTTGRLAFRYFVELGGPNGTNSDYIGIDTVGFFCTTPTPTPTPTATPTPTSAPGG